MISNTVNKIKYWFEKTRSKIVETKRRIEQSNTLLLVKDRLGKKSSFVDRNFWKIFYSLCGLIAVLLFMQLFFWRSPRPFPAHALVSIERGESLSQIAEKFASSGVVRSSFWLKNFVILFGGEKSIIAGDYYFPEPVGVWGVANMIHKGRFGLISLRVTIPEGLSSYEIADILEKQLPSFNRDDFLNEVDDSKLEGYLFPDTYFFMPNSKADDIILMMRENFARNIKEYEADIAKFEKPLDEVMTMASILEGEGNSLESKRLISDILWRRIRKGMPMQVDAPFKYYNGKNSYTLSKEDLQEDHSYNTYVNKGLPPTPINNPGIDSIRAAITPTPNQYWYFMSDKRGNMYYAVDFEGHKRNREAYLD